ncbi:hypothetical protein [Pseudonocardia sp. WMMC193]|uniref:hypothetical protein n=1 Tax=Pseudonocardia sp. WMMC193 TaxID=2911965 RepID=UPI001F2E67C3|nr:hypothetical protein [Pseudonocardia sp. WMMC193]MCF7548923.1 hypothetical protein [Pseudonocardia sp. WMMC193]
MQRLIAAILLGLTAVMAVALGSALGVYLWLPSPEEIGRAMIPTAVGEPSRTVDTFLAELEQLGRDLAGGER